MTKTGRKMSNQTLVYSFFSLAYVVRYDIIKRLELFDESELRTHAEIESRMCDLAFKRATTRGLLCELENEIVKETERLALRKS